MASVGDLWAGWPRARIAAARERGEKRYEARWRKADGRSAKRRFHDRAEAMRHAVESEGIGAVPIVERTVADAVDLYLASKAKLSTKGRENAEHHARHVKIGLGDIPLVELTRERIEGWLGSDPETAASSWQKRLACLRASLKIAKAEDVTDGLVVKQVSEPMDFLTVDELVALARTARTVTPSLHGPKGERARADLWETLLLFLGTSGPRVTEALDINVRDLQVARRRVYVRGTKTVTSRRWVPLSYGMAQRLASLAGDRDGGEPLFTTSRGTRITRERVGDRVRDASVRGIGRQIRVHDLRHTAATHLIEAGGLVVASKILGHANPGITASIYGHATSASIEAAAAAVGRSVDEALGVKPPTPGLLGETVDPDAPF